MTRRSAVFTAAEHEVRLAAARAAMAEAGIDACLMTAPEHLYYFAGYESWVGVNSPQFLVLSAVLPPVLILRNVDLALAREGSVVADIRTYHLHEDDVPALVARVLAEQGVRAGRIGIELQSYALPDALGAALRAALPAAALVDATEILGDLRVIKTASERTLIDQAARFAGAGLAALRDHARAGMTEIALAAEVEGAMRRAGSDYWAIPTELASGWRSAGGHGTPTPKPIEAGDLVHVEFAGAAHRYHAVAFQTLAVGQPAARARELYDCARESLRAGLAAIRPGIPVHDVEEASLVPLRRVGLEKAAMMRFGYGIGIAYPPIWLETLQIARGFARPMATGMVFVAHACLELPDEDLGVILGGTYALEPDGVRMLVGTGDSDLVVL